MDPQQRQWMAQEIARWRKNRLLPAAYCNFLAQLYDVPLDVQEGGGSNETVGSWADRIASLRPMTWLVFFIIFVLFCIIGFHFTAFAAPMQISVIAAPVLVLAALAWSSRKTNLRRSRWLAFLACLTLSGGGWLVLQAQGWRAWWPTVVWLVVSALLWLLGGLLARSGLMQGAGWLHAAAAYGCVLQIAMMDLTLGNSQWLWLPESGLFVWLAWAVHRLSPRASAGLLIASVGLWFMPEAAWAAARPWSQLEADQEMLSFLLGKWIMLWCSAFYFRKQWVKWIREHQTVQAAAADR
ncbi:hypothetical protein [Paenibacillus popilliae]|uniref:DUF2157 domain-containing protein n=1 Tax=Paenibacillus popilliae ATCC 14706 TaxID=1212764 RepID=M9LIK0_PAEPP|nr:hypothetical protein [Paenibacillus popilliae]GAC42950.1 hypothetical protein PPOP_2313 [Paenibacillus popilliae ATCC 14706]